MRVRLNHIEVIENDIPPITSLAQEQYFVSFLQTLVH